MGWPKTAFVVFLVVWQVLLSVFLTLGGLENRDLAVMAKMLWGLNVLWIGGMGLVSLFGRSPARSLLARFPRWRGGQFCLFATSLALMEEAIATLMTNCAPLFGAKVGEVYITASDNYLDVVVFHSVVVFIPQFAAWAWLLSRYAFSPFAVFVLYGLAGLVNETLFAGPQILGIAQWILVYGLMVYLPAYCYHGGSDRRPVKWRHYLLALFLPILFAIPIVVLLLLVVAPGHPSIHFPPMGAK